jgi:hypothetical protein
MLEQNITYYLYRHIRLDKNEPFYIGISSIQSDNNSGYARAERMTNRNHIWNNIYNACNNNVKVEILYETENKEEILKKENEFILLYGRKNLGNGSLANLTDGGLGAVGCVFTDERRNRQSETMKNSPHNLKGKKLPKEWVENIRKQKYGSKNPMFGKHTPISKKVINVETKEVFDTILLAGESIGLKGRLLHQYLSGHRTNKTPFIYLETYNSIGEIESLKTVNQLPKVNRSNSKKVVNISNGKEYENVIEASKDTKYGVVYLRRILSGKKKNKTNLKYKDGL